MEKRIRMNLEGRLEPSEIARFVQIANQYSSTVHIEMEEDRRVNAKSIMGMMNFLSEVRQEVTVRAEGEDEAEAAEALAACLTGRK